MRGVEAQTYHILCCQDDAIHSDLFKPRFLRCCFLRARAAGVHPYHAAAHEAHVRPLRRESFLSGHLARGCVLAWQCLLHRGGSVAIAHDDTGLTKCYCLSPSLLPLTSSTLPQVFTVLMHILATIISHSFALSMNFYHEYNLPMLPFPSPPGVLRELPQNIRARAVHVRGAASACAREGAPARTATESPAHGSAAAAGAATRERGSAAGTTATARDVFYYYNPKYF